MDHEFMYLETQAERSCCSAGLKIVRKKNVKKFFLTDFKIAEVRKNA